jgi:hypothetical protein
MQVSPLRLLRLSQAHKLSDVEAGTRIPDSIISRIERGQTALNAARLELLAAFYGVPSASIAAAMRRWMAARTGSVSHAVELEVPKPPETTA